MKNLLVLFLILFIFTGFASAVDVVISESGVNTIVQTTLGTTLYSGTNDVEAFTTAVENSNNIFINGGTYSFSSPIELYSDSMITGTNSPLLIGYRIFTITDKNNVTISNIIIKNPDTQYLVHSTSYGLIEIKNSNDCFIIDNEFYNFRDYGISISTSSSGYTSNYITIQNNNFHDFGYAGIMIFKNCNYIYVDDNLFTNINTRKLNANAYGVAVAKGSTTYTYPQYIYITNNYINNNIVWEGIDSHGANDLYIMNNTVLNCKIPISVAHQTNEGTYPTALRNVTIVGNYVKGNLDSAEKQHSGIHVLGPANYVRPYENFLIKDNVIEDVNSWLESDDGGIVIRDANGGTIYNNTINNVGGTGIYLENTNDILISANRFTNLFLIQSSTRGIKCLPVSLSTTITIQNNVYDSSCTVHGYGYTFSGYSYTLNLYNETQEEFTGTFTFNTLSNPVTDPVTPTIPDPEDPPVTPPDESPVIIPDDEEDEDIVIATSNGGSSSKVTVPILNDTEVIEIHEMGILEEFFVNLIYYINSVVVFILPN